MYYILYIFKIYLKIISSLNQMYINMQFYKREEKRKRPNKILDYKRGG